MQNGTIVVGGSLAQRPGHGGHAWVFLNYLLGLQRLGWDVFFVDRLEPEMCADMTTNVAWLRDVMAAFDLAERWALLYDGGREVVNSTRVLVEQTVDNATLFLNVMGYIDDERVMAGAERRVFLDIDPGFGQMWQATGLQEMFVGHDDYVTIGENIGAPGCTIPTCGVDWITTKQPVVLGQWPVTPISSTTFTSVVSWRGPFAPVEFEGETYGLRVHEFRRFLELPAKTGEPFELALDIHPDEADDLVRLSESAWNLVDPRVVAGDPHTYRDYVQRSGAELMIAKNLYVRSRSGWFSDRSACYLAAGRAVVAQNTGLDDWLPSGDGLLLFDSLDEAIDAVKAVAADPRRHSRAAREIAEAHFGSDVVLTRLLDRLSVS
ncbi:MAG: hypothetical protein QOC92_3891 [Acidimicrobiaceae bacterium]